MMVSTTDVDDIPEAEPLPALDETEKAAQPSDPVPSPDQDTSTEEDQQESGPPPLPPVLELGASNVATAGGLAYGAAGPAGLVAVGAVAAAGGAAYLAKSARNRRAAAAAAGRDGGKGGRFRALVGRGAGTRGALAGGRGRGGGLRGLSSRARSGAGGPGSARSRLGAGGLGRRGGAPGAGGRGTGALSRLWGRSSGGGSGARGLAGASKGTGLLGKHSRLGGGGGGTGAGALGRAASRAGTRGGRRGGREGLFGAARRRSGGRVTAISDPAMPTRSSSRRPLRGAVGAMRRGWNHPRMRRGRVRFKRASERTHDYMRKRARRLRATAFWHSVAGWWGRLWGRIRGDDRYGPMSSASAAASALAVAALGPSRRRSAPRRALTGRVIGTSARTPGEISARRPLAIGAGASGAELEGSAMARKPGEIIRAESAAEEMRAALAAFGSADVHMLTYEQGLQALPHILRTLGAGLGQMSSSAEGEQPLDPAVVEFMHQISGAVHQVADVAGELPALFRAAHEKELELLEDRRPHAERWDRSRRDN